MALEQSRFFDSVGDDRTYQAEQFAEYFRLFLTDGIKNGGTNLKVTAPGTGMTVNIDYGIALIQGYAYWLENDNTGIKALTIGASTSQPRIDRVILRLDRSLSERQITVAVKEGTPATAPVPPALTRSSNVYELSLAKVSVAANAVKIENANVTDERFNASVCGLINSLITLDGSDFASQATAIINQLSTQGYLPLNGKAADADKLDGLDSTAFAKTSHTHTIANVSNLQATLDGKAPASHSHNYAATSHTHTIANVTSLQATLDGKASTANQVNDNDVPRRATIVPPNTDFNSLTAPGYYYCASNATAATMPNRPFDHAFALMVLNIGSSGPIQIAHIYNNPADHTWLRGLYEGTWTAWKRIKAGEADNAARLNGKADTYFAASSHTHTIANVTSLQATLDGKAASSHTHTIANVSNLQATLDGKAPASHSHNYAAVSHTHTIANVTSLQATLDGKEPTLASDRKRKITISTSNPSGGADGDIWIKVI